MFIPDVGQLIRLTSDWSFDMENMWPNRDLIRRLDFQVGFGLALAPWPVTLPAGTVLKIIKIETRSSGSAYLKSGVKLRTWASPDKRLAPPSRGGTGTTAKFFARLADFNNIEYEVVE